MVLGLGPWSWSLVLGLCSYEHILTTGPIQRMRFQKQPAPRVSAYLSGACFTGGCVPGPAWGPGGPWGTPWARKVGRHPKGRQTPEEQAVFENPSFVSTILYVNLVLA